MTDAPPETAADETDDEAAPPGRRLRPGSGCLLRVLIGIVVVVALVIAIGEIFDQGENAKQPARYYNAGPAAEYKQGDVNFFDQEHIFLVRLPDGEFLAFYDKSARQQELNGTCRISYDEQAGVGTLPPIPGLGGAFVEDCEGSRVVWRVDGTYSFGNGYGPLDQLKTTIDDDGDLIIDTSSRTCTRSKGVPGLEPFEARTCGPPS
jgi:hypothetical protein